MSKCRSRSVCQVSGCTVNLLTEDHLAVRAVTCQSHRQQAIIHVNGKPCRFCQQCVRVHDLDRFDGDKKGCRKRLESHNRRRRKPNVPVASNNAETEGTNGGPQAKRLKTEETSAAGVATLATSPLPDCGTPLSSSGRNVPGEPARVGGRLSAPRGSDIFGPSGPALQAAVSSADVDTAFVLGTENFPWASSEGCYVKASPEDDAAVCPRDFSYPIHTVFPLHGSSDTRVSDKAVVDCTFDISSATGPASCLLRPERQDGFPEYVPQHGGLQFPDNGSLHQTQYSTEDHCGHMGPNRSIEHCFPPSSQHSQQSTASFQTAVPSGFLDQKVLEYYSQTSSGDHKSSSLQGGGWDCTWDPVEMRPPRMATMEPLFSFQDFKRHWQTGRQSMHLPSMAATNDPWGYDDLSYSSIMPDYAGFNITVKLNASTPADLPANLGDELVGILQVPPTRMTGSIRPGCVHLSVDLMFQCQDDADTALTSLHKYIRGPSLIRSPWLSKDSRIRTPGFEHQLHRGMVVNERATSAANPSIVSWGPVAPKECITVRVRGVTQWDRVAVWLRLNGRFHRVDVDDYFAMDDGTIRIHGRLPMVEAGLGWLEVQTGEHPGGMGLSDAKPVFLTSNYRLSNELSSRLPQLYNTTRELTTFLQAVVDAIHPVSPMETKVELWAFMEAVRLAMPNTAEEMFYAADDSSDIPKPGKRLLQQAVVTNEGLVSIAAMSGSPTTLSMVLDLLDGEGLETDACTPSAVSRMTALHWAALAGSRENVLMLLDTCPGARGCWCTLKGGPSGKTPAEIMLQASPLPGEEITEGRAEMIQDRPGASHEVTGPQHEHCGGSSALKVTTMLCSDVWGKTLMSWLTRHRSSTWAVFLPPVILSGASVQQFLLLTLMAVTVQYMIPFVHRNVYMRSLERVRAAAAALGVSISSSFYIQDQALLEAYNQSTVKSAMGELQDLAFLALVIGWFTGTPVFHAYHHHGVFCPWSLLTPVLLFAALAPLRVWAGRRQDVEGCRRVNIVTNMAVVVAGSLPALYCWPAGVYDYTMPTAFATDGGPTIHIVRTAGMVFSATLSRMFLFTHRYSLKAEVLFSAVMMGLIVPAYIGIAAHSAGVSYPDTLLGCGLSHLVGQLGVCSINIFMECRLLCTFFRSLHPKCL